MFGFITFRTFTTTTVGITVNIVSIVPLIKYRNGISHERWIIQTIHRFSILIFISEAVHESVAKMGQSLPIANTSYRSRQRLCRCAARSRQGIVAQRDEQSQVRSQPWTTSEGNFRK